MKRKIVLALIFVLIFSLVLSSCNQGSTDGTNDEVNNSENNSENQNGGDKNDTADDGNNENKRVPVYQGMTITSSVKTATLGVLNGNNKDDFDYEKDNGNHNGHFKGDHTDGNDEIDQENPFPDNENDETIENEAKDSLEVVGPVEDIYYATQNQDIYINIHINNPDDFEIMSFTLNGKKYSSYMFEEGSDMQTIVLKYNVGDSRGVVEYTIDAIKYIDGTDIKDVIIDGDKTVKAGIWVKNQVNAEISAVDVDTNALSFTVNLSDRDSLIFFSKGTAKAVIYDGDKLVASKDLVLGENNVVFEGLKTKTLYQYAVVAYYDDFSGIGKALNTLYKDAFYTDAVVLFDNITLTQSSISYSFAWHEDHVGKSLTSLKLYKDDTLVKALDLNAIAVDNLLSNNIYKLVAEYENLGKTESIQLDFITATNAVPEITLGNLSATQTSVKFDITETDKNNVGAVTKIELVHANGTVVAYSTDVRSFENLLSNNEYTVKVTYVYDLNDGNGEKTLVKELTAKTEAKTIPEITLRKTIQTQTSIGFEINETDTDNVGSVTAIELIHAKGTVAAETLDQRIFTNLYSKNAYKVKITYVYDLNDGNGAKTVTKEIAINTKAKATPEIAIINPTQTKDSIGFEISETDVDDIAVITKIELVHKNGTVVADNTDVRSFENLLSNNEYTVKVTYIYDLNDSKGEHTETKELTIKTNAKATPAVVITNTAKTQDSLNFSINVTDTDNVGAITKVELVHGEDVTVLENVTTHEIKNLLSNNEYTLKVTYTYDFNDGVGVQTAASDITVTTDAKANPSFAVKNDNVTIESINAEYDISDVDNVLTSYKVELYKGSIFVSENSDKKIEFSELDYYTDYTVKFTYNCDLNDGKGEQTFTYDYAFKTQPYIDVLECSIANTSAVSEGETIFMQVKLDNPIGMSITSVVVNGQTYDVTSASTKNKIFVEIVYNGQFAGGDTYLKVDSLSASIDTTTLTATPQTELSDNVFINGRVTVESIEIVDANFVPYEDKCWIFPSQKVYVLIKLNNPTGYVIDSFSRYTKIDDNTYYYEKSAWTGWSSQAYISSLTYHNEYISKTISFSNLYTNTDIYRLSSDTVHYISKPDDLKHMGEHTTSYDPALYYYELTCDIDLSGIEWRGGAFCGVFDGKGYSIKNMSFVGTVDKSENFGLFTYGSGFIQNLNIEEATIIVESDNTVMCGLIVARADNCMYLSINNCHVDENSVVSVKGDAGGMVGYVDQSEYGLSITNCINNGNISGVCAGGMVGYVGYSDYSEYGLSITNCINNGNISGDDAGGIVGYVDCSEYGFSITNCINNGNISGNHAGGMVAAFYGYSALIITNILNIGNVDGNSAAGIVAYLDSESYVKSTNTYSLTIENGDYNGTLCTIEQLNTKEFYTETLGWSEDVWDFSELDVEQGKYPKLK